MAAPVTTRKVVTMEVIETMIKNTTDEDIGSCKSQRVVAVVA
jgi:hypothetical protein